MRDELALAERHDEIWEHMKTLRLRARPAVAAAPMVAAWMCVPGVVSAQEYARWYQQSERHFTEPFLREFIVRPEEVWLVTEQQGEVRRIYTSVLASN